MDLCFEYVDAGIYRLPYEREAFSYSFKLAFPEQFPQLCLKMVQMKFKGQKKDVMLEISDFKKRSTVEPDILIMVCSHSQAFTGDQVYSQSSKNHSAAPIDDVR
jgi:hypothetical protein